MICLDLCITLDISPKTKTLNYNDYSILVLFGKYGPEAWILKLPQDQS